MADPVALGALVLDVGCGWPALLHRRIGHPVGGFARLIHLCERNWNHPALSSRVRRWRGVATLLLLMIVVVSLGWAIERAVSFVMGQWAWIGLAIAAWPALAQRSLHDHVAPVVRALTAGNLPSARQGVSRIVGRDTASLDEQGVARAAIESLAESFCDGVVAPLFWLLLGGLPGIWAYKAVNTADSLIGHREEPFGPFGWAAARFDDLLNLVPARLAAVLLCVAGGGGWRVMWRDHARHDSPNAGWPEAAMAGVLKVRLAGPIHYDGVRHDKPWIGEGERGADAGRARMALLVYRRACILLWVITILVEGLH